MSHVADIILLTEIDDETDGRKNPDRLSDYLRKHHNGCELKRIDEYAGGNKAFQSDAWAAAINYMNIEGFLAAFRAVPWETPECVLLMIRDEHDEQFTVYRPDRSSYRSRD